MRPVGGRFSPFYLLAALSFVIVSAAAYLATTEIERTVELRLVSELTSVVRKVFDNVAGEILREVGREDIVLTLFRDARTRKKVEGMLSILVGEEIRYVYILYRDADGKFRFLADGSRTDRAQPGERFDVLNEEAWLEALNTGREKVILQEGLKSVGATYIRPLMQNGEVKALMVADFSIEKTKEIEASLGQVRAVMSSATGILTLLLILNLYQLWKRKRLERTLYVDTLTGLYNKSFLDEQAFRLNLGDYYVALVDVDDFRKVNSTFGEEVGDTVLRELASMLKSLLPKDSILVRYAGEEFLTLLPKGHFKDKVELIRYLEFLKSRVKSRVFTFDGYEVKVSVSVGVNLSTDRSRSFEEALRGADLALYRAKKGGKDRVEAFDESVEESRKRLSVLEVADAIDKGRLICYYQPVVELQSGRVSHYEALVRIVTEDGKVVPPSYSLEDLRDTFVYTRFVKEVIELNRRLLMRRKDVLLSVNLFPTDVISEDILTVLRSLEEDIRRRMLLEITEVERLPSFDRVKSSLEELRRLGFRICIDDFGAGYSNLVNLTQLRIDFLKIDGSIVRDVHRNRVSYLLIKMVSDFCREIGVEVIAEYVENREVLEKLRSIGVKYGQGYLIGKPEPFNV